MPTLGGLLAGEAPPVEQRYPTTGLMGLLQRFGEDRASSLSRFLQNPVQSVSDTVYGILPTRPEGEARINRLRGLLAGPETPEEAAYKRKMFDLAAAGLTVYHGTPNKWAPEPGFPEGRPRLDKIGTGEGAQAYGHGMYFAENPSVAQQYADNVKDMAAVQRINAELSALAKAMSADEIPGQYRKYRTDKGRAAAARYDELMAQREGVFSAPGTMYRTDLPDELIPGLLNWDAPLGKQSPSVQAAIRKTRGMLPPNAADDLGGDFNLLYGRDVMPGQFLNTLTSIGGRADSGEQLLRQAGVPGLLYLDNGSRSAGQGTRNFVIWDQDLLNRMTPQK